MLPAVLHALRAQSQMDGGLKVVELMLASKGILQTNCCPTRRAGQVERKKHIPERNVSKFVKHEEWFRGFGLTYWLLAGTPRFLPSTIETRLPGSFGFSPVVAHRELRKN